MVTVPQASWLPSEIDERICLETVTIINKYNCYLYVYISVIDVIVPHLENT
jgi:hypothetical protein